MTEKIRDDEMTDEQVEDLPDLDLHERADDRAVVQHPNDLATDVAEEVVRRSNARERVEVQVVVARRLRDLRINKS